MLENVQTYEFTEVIRQNDESLDQRVEAHLGCYVYVLMTTDGRAFYVGKGGGAGDGNLRILAHFDEAASILDSKRLPVTSKQRRILETWKQEQKVRWFIARHGLDEKTAGHVEAALIDTLPMTPNGELDNLVRGPRVVHGILDSLDVSALNAPPVSPAHPYSKVFVFQIQNALEEGRDPYEAIRGDWTVRTENRVPAIAVGVKGGISRIVCDVRDWFERPSGSGKQAFSGDVLAKHELLDKSFINAVSPARGFLRWGGGYTILEFDGEGNFRCLRGAGDAKQWHRC